MRRITLPPIALTISLAGLIGGCASLEQAPLTYSSVNTMGIAVAAATPQQPGIDLTIGYKGADVAYTPVAVAKKCGEKPTADCYKIIPIEGSSDGVTKSSTSKAYDDAVRALQDAKKRREIAEAALRDESISSAKAENECKVANGTRDGLPEAVDPTVKQKAIEAATAACAAYNTMKTGSDERVAALNSAITAAQEQEKNAEAEVGRLAAESSTDNKRKDSYSVFGTFNGNSNGNTNGGGLQLGKTFSTGVAAQRYSEGLKNAAATVAIKQCFEAATAMLSKVADTDGAMVKQALSLCAGPVQTTDQ